MGDTVLDVRCDRAAAPHSTVAVGAGWARITLCGPRGQMDDLPRALRMLAAARCGGASPDIRVSGPDAPANPAPLRREVLRVWAAHWVDGDAAGVADGVAAGVADGVAAGVDDGGAAARLAARVAAHARRHGAAPDFAAARPAARGKVYNYIRSISGDLRASDELVEAARLCLARRAAHLEAEP